MSKNTSDRSAARAPPPSRAQFGALRSFIVLYVLMYAAFGVASPFWPRFFETRGMTPEQIGLLFGLGTMVRLIAGPAGARIADRHQQLRGVLASAAALAACFALGLLWIREFWIFLLVHLCQAASLAPTTSLADALALGASKSRSDSRDGFEYGWVRGSGSAAFVLGTILVGQIIVMAELSAIVWMHAALLLGAAFGALLVPAPDRDSEDAPEPLLFGAITELLGIVAFRRVVLVAALVYGSHAMHDAFAVIQWSAAGISPATISVLWSEAVAAEVVIFILIGPRIIDAVGPGVAAAISVAAAIARWIVMASSANPLVLAIVQPLHGMTFALLHLACMRLMAATVPQHLAATAQATYALVPGLITALLTLLSGILYARFGANGFLLMALLSALALPLCPGLQSSFRR